MCTGRGAALILHKPQERKCHVPLLRRNKAHRKLDPARWFSEGWKQRRRGPALPRGGRSERTSWDRDRRVPGHPKGVAKVGGPGRPHPLPGPARAEGSPGESERPLPPNIPPGGEGAHGEPPPGGAAPKRRRGLALLAA